MKPRFCIARPLPQNMLVPHRTTSTRAVAPLGKQWINGSTLRVKFLNGTSDQMMRVVAQTKDWERVCNLKFEFTSGQSDIRITFNEHDGAWSYVGTDCKMIPQDQPTMNLGWTDGGVILHEFGHALGLGHEHQNPQGGIEWNEEQVIRDVSGPPNYWDETTIWHNILNKYSLDHVRASQFDPNSIMLYFFPASWTRNGIATHENEVLSAGDKQFMTSVMYPFTTPTNPTTSAPSSRELKTNSWSSTSASFRRTGEEHLYHFDAKLPGRYVVHTHGNLDTVIRLYGPDSHEKLVSEDDNSGLSKNAQIIRSLKPGRYWAQVRHNSGRVGSYSIRAKYY